MGAKEHEASGWSRRLRASREAEAAAEAAPAPPAGMGDDLILNEAQIAARLDELDTETCVSARYRHEGPPVPCTLHPFAASPLKRHLHPHSRPCGVAARRSSQHICMLSSPTTFVTRSTIHPLQLI